MRIIIAGSRDFNDYELVFHKCHEIFQQLSQEGYLTNNVREDVKPTPLRDWGGDESKRNTPSQEEVSLPE